MSGSMSIDGDRDSSLSSPPPSSRPVTAFDLSQEYKEKMEEVGEKASGTFLDNKQFTLDKTNEVAQKNLPKESPVKIVLPVNIKGAVVEVVEENLLIPANLHNNDISETAWVNSIMSKLAKRDASHLTIKLDNFPTSKYTHYSALQREIDSRYPDIEYRPTIDLRLRGANAKEGDHSFGILGGLIRPPGSDADMLQKVMNDLKKKGIDPENVNIDLYCCPPPMFEFARRFNYRSKVDKFFERLNNSKFCIANTSNSIDFGWYSKRARSGEAEDVLINLAQEVVRKVASDGTKPKKLLVLGSEGVLYPKAIKQVKEKFAQSKAQEPDIQCISLGKKQKELLEGHYINRRRTQLEIQKDLVGSEGGTIAKIITQVMNGNDPEQIPTHIVLSSELSNEISKITVHDDEGKALTMLESLQRKHNVVIQSTEDMLVDRMGEEIEDNVIEKLFFEENQVDQLNREEMIEPKPGKPRNILEELDIKPGDFIFTRDGAKFSKVLQRLIGKEHYIDTHVAVVVNVSKDKIMMLESLESGVCLSTLSIEQFKRNVGKGIDILKARGDKKEALSKEIAKVAKSFAKYYREQKAQGNLTKYSFKHLMLNFLSSKADNDSRIASTYTADSDHAVTSDELKRSAMICSELAANILISAQIHLQSEALPEKPEKISDKVSAVKEWQKTGEVANLTPKHVTPSTMLSTLYEQGFTRVTVIRTEEEGHLPPGYHRYENYVISPEKTKAGSTSILLE